MSNLIETNYPPSSLGSGMKYIKLGKSGLEVSQICCGTMGFGDLNRWGRKWLVGQDGAAAVVKKALELGINWFDTANIYSLGASEEILGEARKRVGANRDELVIQTKVNQRMAEGPNMAGSSRKAIMREIDKSLKRLQLDYVDVYILHRWDWDTPIEETMSAMNDVVKAGKARYIGASAMFAWQFEKAYRCAERHDWENFISMQNHYNLLYREDERELMDALLDAGVASTPYSPLAAGKCAHPWNEAHNRTTNDFKTQVKYTSAQLHPKHSKSSNDHRVYATFASSHLPARPFRSLRPFCTPARGLSNPGKKQSLTQSVRPRKVGSAPGGLTACYRLTAHKKSITCSGTWI